MSTWRGSNNVACSVPEQGNWSWGCSAVTCDLDLHGYDIRNNPQLMPAEIQRRSPTQSGSRTGDQNDWFLKTLALFSLILHWDTSYGTYCAPTRLGYLSIIMAKTTDMELGLHLVSSSEVGGVWRTVVWWKLSKKIKKWIRSSTGVLLTQFWNCHWWHRTWEQITPQEPERTNQNTFRTSL